MSSASLAEDQPQKCQRRDVLAARHSLAGTKNLSRLSEHGRNAAASCSKIYKLYAKPALLLYSILTTTVPALIKINIKLQNCIMLKRDSNITKL